MVIQTKKKYYTYLYCKDDMNGETFHDAKTGNELPNINIDVPTNILEQKVKTLEGCCVFFFFN